MALPGWYTRKDFEKKGQFSDIPSVVHVSCHHALNVPIGHGIDEWPIIDKRSVITTFLSKRASQHVASGVNARSWWIMENVCMAERKE